MEEDEEEDEDQNVGKWASLEFVEIGEGEDEPKMPRVLTARW